MEFLEKKKMENYLLNLKFTTLWVSGTFMLHKLLAFQYVSSMIYRTLLLSPVS